MSLEASSETASEAPEKPPYAMGFKPLKSDSWNNVDFDAYDRVSMRLVQLFNTHRFHRGSCLAFLDSTSEGLYGRSIIATLAVISRPNRQVQSIRSLGPVHRANAALEHCTSWKGHFLIEQMTFNEVHNAQFLDSIRHIWHIRAKVLPIISATPRAFHVFPILYSHLLEIVT